MAVYDRILKQMRGKVRTRQYVMTLHAEEETLDGDRVIVVVSKFGYADRLVILTVYVEG